MLKITIKDVLPYDGEYEYGEESDPFNGHELHLIKKVSGVRLGEIDEAMAARDYDLYISIATILLWRDGKATRQTALPVADALLDAEGGKIKFVFSDDVEEAEERPPTSASPPGSESLSDDANEPAASSRPSFELLQSTGGGPQETTPPVTGAPGSAADAV